MSKPVFWKFASGDKTCFVLSIVTEKALRPFKFDLTIYEGSNVWKTEVNNNLLQELANDAQTALNDFCFFTKRALTGEDPEEPEERFVFEINKSNLIWKKQMVGGTQSFKYGTLRLNKLETGEEHSIAIQELLTYSYDQIKTLTERCESLSHENFVLNQDKIGALERVDEALSAKNECESILLTKFVEVLNSKKQKIFELQREMDNENEPGGSSSTVKPKPDVKSKLKGRSKADEADESGNDTDEEKELFEQRRLLAAENNSKPLLEDTDLILHATRDKPKKSDAETTDCELFVPKRRGRPGKASDKTDKTKTVEKNKCDNFKNKKLKFARKADTAPVENSDKRRSLRSQTSTSSLLEKLS